MDKSVWDYKLYIFDLDGTLYYQKPFRMRMLLYLVGYVVVHPASVKDLLLIKFYREVRENWDKIYPSISDTDKEMTLDGRQFRYVAEKKNVSAERVERAVNLFILNAPLALLPAFCDTKLRSWIRHLRERGSKVVIYSDYPVKEKLDVLQIEADALYTSADERIGSMKPDPKGIETILADFGVAAADALMIGDRYEKDGLAAEKCGVNYMILSSRKRDRKKLESIFAGSMG